MPGPGWRVSRCREFPQPLGRGREVEVACQDDRLFVACELLGEGDGRPQLGLRRPSLPGVGEVEVDDDHRNTALVGSNADPVTDAALLRPLDTASAQHASAVLQHRELPRDEDRVRLTRERRAKHTMVDIRRPPSQPAEPVPCPRREHGHPAPLLELRQRPERELLKAHHVGRVLRDELDRVPEVRPAAGRIRAAVEDVPAPDEHRHPSERVDEPLHVLLGVPVTARDPYPARLGDVSHDDAGVIEASDRVGGLAFGHERDERPLAGRGDDVEALGEELAAALGDRARVVVARRRRGPQRDLESGERRHRDRPRIEALCAVDRRERPVRARARRATSTWAARQPVASRSRTYSAPVASGPHSHFCPDTV